MSNFSNIEIVNFDEMENNQEYSIDLEHEIGLNYLNNHIIERNESDYLESNSDSCLYQESTKNFSIYSQNNSNKNLDTSCNSSNFGDSRNLSDNFNDMNIIKKLNLDDSPLQLEESNQFNKTFINESFNENFYNEKNFKKNKILNTKIKIKSFNNVFEEDSIQHLNNPFLGFDFSLYIETNPNQKVFECKQVNCSKTYKSKENLILHIKNIHLKQKPYSCKYCPSLFSHRNGKKNKIYD